MSSGVGTPWLGSLCTPGELWAQERPELVSRHSTFCLVMPQSLSTTYGLYLRCQRWPPLGHVFPPCEELNRLRRRSCGPLWDVGGLNPTGPQLFDDNLELHSHALKYISHTWLPIYQQALRRYQAMPPNDRSPSAVWPGCWVKSPCLAYIAPSKKIQHRAQPPEWKAF